MDAICINEEHQIGRMPQIYGYAKSRIVWLGEQRNTTRQWKLIASRHAINLPWHHQGKNSQPAMVNGTDDQILEITVKLQRPWLSASG